MTDNLKVAMEAINKWVYFSLNYNVVSYTYNQSSGESTTVYVPEFLVAINWTCPISHMIGKWKYASRSEDAHSYLTRFYTELDSQNSELLMEWVMNNYNDEIKLSY